MSKRIIKYGKYNKIECLETDGGCGCEFTFDKEDIITKENGGKVVTCPQCGKEHTPKIKGAN